MRGSYSNTYEFLRWISFFAFITVFISAIVSPTYPMGIFDEPSLSPRSFLDKLIKPFGSGLSGASPIDINGGDFNPSLFSKTNFAEADSAQLTKPQIIPLH